MKLSKIMMWLVCISSQSFAAIYTYTDKDGRVVYSDDVPSGQKASKIVLPPSNEIKLTTNNAKQTNIKKLTTSVSNNNVRVIKNHQYSKVLNGSGGSFNASIAIPSYKYSSLIIANPSADAGLNNPDGIIDVSIISEPSLLPGHKYRALVDGMPVEESNKQSFSLNNIDRGSHSLMVEIIDEQGRVIERTAEQPVHIQRLSLKQKRNINPCNIEDFGVRAECPIAEKPQIKPKFFPFWSN